MSVVSSYPTHAQDHTRMVVKLRTLVQELPSLIEGGKEGGCTLHLQLIHGYLQALGLGTSTSSDSKSARTSGSAGKALTATSFPSQEFIRKYWVLNYRAHDIDGVLHWNCVSPRLQFSVPNILELRGDGCGFYRQFKT